MATITSPTVIQNMMDNDGRYVDDRGEHITMQAYLIYAYRNVGFRKIDFCVCYGPPDDIALRRSPFVGEIQLLWQKGIGVVSPIGTLRKRLEGLGVELNG